MNFRNHKNLIKLFLVICSAVTLVYFVHFVGITYIHEIFRGQAIFVILLGAFSIRKFISVTGQTSWARWLVVLTFCGWALLMLYKVPLRAINFNYGRLHCLPGVIASIACLTLVMPLHFEKYYRSGWIVKTIICTLLLIVCAVTFSLSIGWAGLRMIPLGHGANKLWAYSSSYPSGPGYDVDLFLKWAEVNIKPEETFVAFPQGAMLNFLTRHRMTGRHITFMPAEMIAYGEESMLDTLTAEPPDYFLFINNDIRINGNFIVGHEYGSMIYNWVNTNYIPVWQTGKEFGNYGFGITVLKRRPY